MKPYLNLLDHILTNGVNKSDHLRVGYTKCFGYQMRFDLSQGFPMLPQKVAQNPLFMSYVGFKGDTNTKYLNEHGVSNLG